MDGSDIFKDISVTINYTLADLIKDVVDTSNEKKILYHGIKRGSSIKQIKKEGLKPLTPESVYCSFWATGMALFNPTNDSPFFTYSASTSPYDPEICELNLAVTKYDLLTQKGLILEYKEDSQIRIKEIVPYDALALINVRVKHPFSEDHLRRFMTTAEQMLLKAIVAQIYGVFSPGKTIKHFKEIK
jgi:hypothetical protein